MISIYKFRAYCPICNIILNAKKSAKHITKVHSEVSENDLKYLEKFISDSERLILKSDKRLILNLRELTFEELPNKTIFDSIKNHNESDSEKTTDIEFIKCKKCNKLILSGNIFYHDQLLHSPELKLNKSRNCLSQYSQVRGLILFGYPVQGGTPSLGKKR